MSDRVETMMAVGQAPWHNKGKVLTVAPKNTAEGIEASGLNWEVELKPLFLGDGRRVEANAIVRKSDNHILGHHVGMGFQPLQNIDAFKWFDPFIESGLCSFETAGSLCEGSRIWVLAKLNREDTEVAPGDFIRKYLLLSNSHEYGVSIRVGLTPVRVVCWNTLTLSHNSVDSKLIRVRHTGQTLRVLGEIREIVNVANNAFEATCEQYRKLAKSKIVNQNDLRKYVTQVLNLTEKTEGVLSTRSENTFKKVMEYIVNGKGNATPEVSGTWWTAFNGLNEFLCYSRGRTEETRLNSVWFGDSAVKN